MKVLQTPISDELHQRLKVQAAKERATLIAMTSRVLCEYLDKQEQRQPVANGRKSR